MIHRDLISHQKPNSCHGTVGCMFRLLISRIDRADVIILILN